MVVMKATDAVQDRNPKGVQSSRYQGNDFTQLHHEIIQFASDATPSSQEKLLVKLLPDPPAAHIFNGLQLRIHT